LALEQDVVGWRARLLLGPWRGIGARLGDQLITGLEDNGLLVGHFDAVTGQWVLIGAPLTDSTFERAEALDCNLAAAVQQVADRVEHCIENTGCSSPWHIEFLGDC